MEQTTTNSTLGIIDEFDIAAIDGDAVLGRGGRCVMLTTTIMEKMDPQVGDRFFVFTGNLVGTLKVGERVYKDRGESARYQYAFQKARSRMVNGHYWLRVVLIDQIPLWVPAFELPAVE